MIEYTNRRLTALERHELMAHLQRALASTSDFVQYNTPPSAGFDRQAWFGAQAHEIDRTRQAIGNTPQDEHRDPDAAVLAELIANRLHKAAESIETDADPTYVRKLIASAIRFWAEGIELG